MNTFSLSSQAFSRALAAVVAVVLMGGMPLSAAAATAKPTCVLNVTTPEGTVRIRDKGEILLVPGSELRIAWESKNAVTAEDRNGNPIARAGAATSSPVETTPYSYHFFSGSKEATCKVTVFVVTGSIDTTSLTSASTKPTLSGTLVGVKSGEITIRKVGETKKAYTSRLAIHKGEWKEKISKKLTNGTYEVEISGGKDVDIDTIVRGVLTIDTEGKKVVTPVMPTANTTLAVSPVPLLFGGTARAGAAVPVSYLQITNVGKEPALLKGFWIRQTGSASTQSVIGLSTVDDQGGSRGSVGGLEGSTPFVNGLAFAPTDAQFAPGQMRLFTVKTVLSNNVSAYFGQQLMMEVAGLDASAALQGLFPIRGTTWTIGN